MNTDYNTVMHKIKNNPHPEKESILRICEKQLQTLTKQIEHTKNLNVRSMRMARVSNLIHMTSLYIDN
mgnify:FL=1